MDAHCGALLDRGERNTESRRGCRAGQALRVAVRRGDPPVHGVFGPGPDRLVGWTARPLRRPRARAHASRAGLPVDGGRTWKTSRLVALGAGRPVRRVAWAAAHAIPHPLANLSGGTATPARESGLGSDRGGGGV